jgi:Amidase
MNDSERSSPDHYLDRRTVLKVAAGASAAVVAPRAVSGAVLANNNEIVALSARAAADYIRRGELSAERYAQVLLERYKAHTNLNVVAHIDEAKLLEDAREVDGARVRGAQLGPLAGLPVIIKDNVNTVGFPTNRGNAIPQGLSPESKCAARRHDLQQIRLQEGFLTQAPHPLSVRQVRAKRRTPAGLTSEGLPAGLELDAL